MILSWNESQGSKVLMSFYEGFKELLDAWWTNNPSVDCLSNNILPSPTFTFRTVSFLSVHVLTNYVLSITQQFISVLHVVDAHSSVCEVSAVKWPADDELFFRTFCLLVFSAFCFFRPFGVFELRCITGHKSIPPSSILSYGLPHSELLPLGLSKNIDSGNWNSGNPDNE